MAVITEDKTIIGLNQKQKEAVEHDQGPLLIIAGVCKDKRRCPFCSGQCLESKRDSVPSGFVATRTS